MTQGAQKWRYKLVEVQFDTKQVNKVLEEWAAAGWDLVSGSASTAAVGMNVGTTYAMYWRKQI